MRARTRLASAPLIEAIAWRRSSKAEPGRADEELASEDVNGDLITVIPLPIWSHIRLAGLEHAVLVAAEHGGLADVNSLIRPTCLRADRPPKSAAAAAADPLARSALTTLSARQCSPRPAGWGFRLTRPSRSRLPAPACSRRDVNRFATPSVSGMEYRQVYPVWNAVGMECRQV